MDTVILQGADHFQSSSITDVCKARVLVSTEIPLKDAALLRSVKEGTPGFQLAHSVG